MRWTSVKITSWAREDVSAHFEFGTQELRKQWRIRRRFCVGSQAPNEFSSKVFFRTEPLPKIYLKFFLEV